MKNVTPKGKLDNFWEDEIYMVLVKPNEDIPVYIVQREDGKGRKRTLHRNLLLACPLSGLPTKEQFSEKQNITKRSNPNPREQAPTENTSGREESSENERDKMIDSIDSRKTMQVQIGSVRVSKRLESAKPGQGKRALTKKNRERCGMVCMT